MRNNWDFPLKTLCGQWEMALPWEKNHIPHGKDLFQWEIEWNPWEGFPWVPLASWDFYPGMLGLPVLFGLLSRTHFKYNNKKYLWILTNLNFSTYVTFLSRSYSRTFFAQIEKKVHQRISHRIYTQLVAHWLLKSRWSEHQIGRYITKYRVTLIIS